MDEKPFESLNVVPFIDVMLVLLTMVLTTANFIATGRIPVSLPQASRVDVDKRDEKIIEIAADGALSFDSARITLDALQEKVASLPQQTSFLIRADRAVGFQSFVDVADLLEQRHFSKVAVQTRGAKKAAAP
jgi:biopolymer transport protein ExbD